MAKIDGITTEAGTRSSKKRLKKLQMKILVKLKNIYPSWKIQVLVQHGDFVHKGQLITEGAKDPHESLKFLVHQLYKNTYLRKSQKSVPSSGVTINDKHLEVIISRMLFKVRIILPGWKISLGRPNRQICLLDANESIAQKRRETWPREPILLGITKASLETDSFISAASFKQNNCVLTNAATLGKVDELWFQRKCHYGPSHIPAGTGLPKWRRLKVDSLGSATSEPMTA